MKQNLFNILLIAIVAICALGSCGRSDAIYGDSDNVTSVNPYDFIGKLHNSTMDSIKVSKINQEHLVSYTNKIVEENFKGVQTYADENEVKPVLIKIINRSKEYELSTRASTLIDDSIMKNVPEQCLPYIDEMRDIVETNLTDTLAIIRHFGLIEESIAKDLNLDEEDKACLLAISAIGKYSKIYNIPIGTRSVTSGGVARADIEGAIGNVFCWRCFGKSAASGLVFGPSGVVMTVAKEAVRGAIAGSAVSLISYMLF